MSRLKPEFNVKMIVIGDSGVGKTHLVRCYEDKVNALLQASCSVNLYLRFSISKHSQGRN